MRADRLISLLMLLQARGRMTARRLADELEVSERTIYRDIDSLSAAGVPVYAERGPGGGCALVDSYRTTLTGLTESETRALFMLSIPAPLDDLGVSQELRAAMLKLAAALPASRRHDEAWVRQRIHLDSVAWFQAVEPLPHLQTVHQAVWEDRKLWLQYRSAFASQLERVVEPYGLVAKASSWYLVCATASHLRVQRVSDIVAARVLEDTFERPARFDLSTFWESWRDSHERNRPHFPVTLRVSPELAPYLSPRYFRQVKDVTQVAAPDEEGWVTVTLDFEEFDTARLRVLGWGRAAEVLAPVALRLAVVDFAEQVAALYRERGEMVDDRD